MKVTDEQRSMIASAFVGAFTCQEGDSARSLCCAPDRLAACAEIVGRHKAERLANWCFVNLGCFGFPGVSDFHDNVTQHGLDIISGLEEL